VVHAIWISAGAIMGFSIGWWLKKHGESIFANFAHFGVLKGNIEKCERRENCGS